MEERKLAIKSREKTGSSAGRKSRREGRVPVVVSFPDATSLKASVEEREFVHLAQASKYTDVIYLNSDNDKLNGLQVLVKDFQREPLKGKLLHVDFQALQEGVRVKVNVPVKLVGMPEGVKTQGGILTQTANTVVLSCWPKSIPAAVEADVSALLVGERILASDINLPDDVIMKSNVRENIASVVASRITRLQDAAGEGLEAADGEPGAEGAEAAPDAEGGKEGGKEAAGDKEKAE